MVTTASTITREMIKTRSLKYTLYLWSIPIFAWCMLITAFFLTRHDSMVRLITADQDKTVQNIESYLKSKQIAFMTEGYDIWVEPGDKSMILKELSQQTWFDPHAGWETGSESPLVRIGPDINDSKKIKPNMHTNEGY